MWNLKFQHKNGKEAKYETRPTKFLGETTIMWKFFKKENKKTWNNENFLVLTSTLRSWVWRMLLFPTFLFCIVKNFMSSFLLLTKVESLFSISFILLKFNLIFLVDALPSYVQYLAIVKDFPCKCSHRKRQTDETLYFKRLTLLILSIMEKKLSSLRILVSFVCHDNRLYCNIVN